jgi:hypothetical protein
MRDAWLRGAMWLLTNAISSARHSDIFIIVRVRVCEWCIRRILDRNSSILGLCTGRSKMTKPLCVSLCVCVCVCVNVVQVLSSTMTLARFRTTHTTVLWFISYHMNICDPTGTQHEAFSLNQLNFSTQTLLENLYSMAEYHALYTSRSAWRAAVDLRLSGA